MYPKGGGILVDKAPKAPKASRWPRPSPTGHICLM